MYKSRVRLLFQVYSIENGKTSLSELLRTAGGLEINALASAAYLILESANQRGVSSVQILT